MTITVVLADDQDMIRAGLRLVLQSEPDIEVVGEASDGAELLAVTARERPHVALVDVRMPSMDGLAAAAAICADQPATRVVMLTTFEEERYLEEALRIGVSGFVIKVSPPERLVTAVRTAAAGDALIDPVLTRRLIASFAARRAEPIGVLTPREVEVLRHLATGKSNAEIADALFVSGPTVKTHVARILAKLGLRDRVQAVVWAYEHGLARPGGTSDGR
jgi:DNA-binding NarL/FixJ family response regulator